MITNIISPSASIGENFRIGCYCVIENDVIIGDNVYIGNGVIIYGDTVIGNNVIIQDNVIVGKSPVRAKNSVSNMMKETDKESNCCIIMDNCIIGTSSVLYRGCTLGKDCYVADQAAIREGVVVGEGTIIGRGVLIENQCTVGRLCKLEANAYITAHSDLDDYVFVAPGVVTTNDNFAGRTKKRVQYMRGVTVEKGGRIGANSTILPGKVIGEDALVAAGCVVTKDVDKETVVKGCPGKAWGKVPEEQLLNNNIQEDGG